jgi:hypothetical protein
MDILDQITAARHSTPGADGVLHGRQKIRFGKLSGRAALFFSVKNGAYIPVSSRLQFAFCFELEADPQVRLYRTNAVEVPTRSSSIYAHFLTWGETEQPSAINVVRSNRADNPRTITKLAFLEAALRAVGVSFQRVTEREIPQGTLLDNAMHAYNRGGKAYPHHVVMGFAIEAVDRLQPEERTVARVRALFRDMSYPDRFLEAAIFYRRLGVRGNGRLVPDALVEVLHG